MWKFSTFGTNTSIEDNGCEINEEKQDITLWSKNGRGKLVPLSTDGIATVYETIPSDKAFKLSADIEVMDWTFTNGQDGFGLIACDKMYENGSDVTAWNNSYMVSASKIDYCYDAENDFAYEAGPSSENVYSMRIGLLAQEKRGIDTISENNAITAKKLELTRIPLDYSIAQKGYRPGVYNLVENYKNKSDSIVTINGTTKFHFQIERLSNGYILSCNDKKAVFENKNEKDPLLWLDDSSIYVGFFTARNAKINISNIELVVNDLSASGKVPKTKQISKPLLLQTISGAYSNKPDYNWLITSNKKGKIKVYSKGKDDIEKNVGEYEIACNTINSIPLPLNSGKNTFYGQFFSHESNNEGSIISLDVSFSDKKPTKLVVGNANELINAINSAVPGDHILLKKGIYLFEKQLVIGSEISGNTDKPIILEAEEVTYDIPEMPFFCDAWKNEEAKIRPVFDFSSTGEGMLLIASNWILRGFDITASKPYTVGFKVSGSNNILEGLKTYKNGNTGFQINRYNEYQPNEVWPANNYIKNCTSFLNSDPGHTDSDGFACKITCGPGNILDGCISMYNSDDGFDCFAKVETGKPGSVVIKNSITHRNGFIINNKGEEQHVGLGIGFKLGGSCIACGHHVENSISIMDGLNGVSSNTSPDGSAKNLIIIDAVDSNVDMSCHDMIDTDYSLYNIQSVRTDRYSVKNTSTIKHFDTTVNIKSKEAYKDDIIVPVGRQDISKLNSSTNDFWNNSKQLKKSISFDFNEIIGRKEDGTPYCEFYKIYI